MHKLKPEVFVNTSNWAAFEDLMRRMEDGAGKGRFACVYGQAGRGKTCSAIRWHATNGTSIYLRTLRIWADSPGAMLRAILWELGELRPPHRNDDRFRLVVEELKRRHSPPIFIDEIEKLPAKFLEILRDLTDASGSPLILIGEEELLYALRRERKCWSRTDDFLHFEPLGLADVIAFSQAAIGCKLPGEVAKIFWSAAEGDFRPLVRDLGAAVRKALARRMDRIDEDVARAAVKAGLRPGPRGPGVASSP